MTHDARPIPPDLSPRAFAWALGVLVAVVFAWMQWVTWTQYASNRVFLADAGAFDAMIAGPLHGTFLQLPTQHGMGVNYFATHFQPVLLLITPLYLVADHVMTYLTVLNAALVLAMVPLALLAAHVLGSRLLALAVALLYSTNHFVASIHLANHSESLALVAFFAMFLAFERRRPVWYAVAFAWLLLLKEDLAVYTGLYGATLLLERDKSARKWGLVTLGVSIAGFVAVLTIIKLMGRDVLAASDADPLRYYRHMGDSVPAILLHMATHPVEVARRLFDPMLLLLLASVAFLPLLDWRRLIAIVLAAGVFFLANDHAFATLQYYYSYSAIPFLFLGTVKGANLLIERFPTHRRTVTVAMSALFLLIAAVSAGLPTRTDGYRRVPFEVTEHHRLARDFNRLVPRDAAIAVQYDLFTKISNRKVKLPLRGHTIDDVEYVFFDVHGRAPDLYGEERREEAVALFERILSDEFETVFEADGYFLRRRAVPRE